MLPYLHFTKLPRPGCPAAALSVLLAAALLAGCGAQSAAPGSETPAGPPPQPAPSTAGDTGGVSAAQPAATGFVTLGRTDQSYLGCGGRQGFYELRYDDAGAANILYIDYATAQEVYLCAAPNCTHDHEGCTAWIDPEEGSYIPLVSGEQLLLVHIAYGYEEPQRAIPHIDAAGLDGSDRHTLVEFAANERLKSVFAVNGDTLVCALNAVDPDDAENVNATLKLVQIDLNTGERTDFYERAVQIGGEPVFMGVTENGYCVLREQYTAKSEADFPGREWAEIADEIARSTQYTCTIIPVGCAQPAGTLTYSGRVCDLLCSDGLYYFDCDSREVTRVSIPDGTSVALTELPDAGAVSAYLDGKLGDWFLLSQRYYEDRPEVSYPAAVDDCYAVHVQTGELRALSIRQEVAADRRMCCMLGTTDTDVLLITDSDVPELARSNGFAYSLIAKEEYLNSNAAALRPVARLP